jgi:hypothetical protein
MWITWKDKGEELIWPLTIEKKVDIFYQQILGWQLHIADLIANGGVPLGGGAKVEPIQHSGFAVLQICLSYFETVGKYQSPSVVADQENFKLGVQAVFPLLQNIPCEVREKLLSAFWKEARCGLYHNSRTGRGVGVGQPPNGEAMAYTSEVQLLIISPERLPKALKEHLERYRTELLDPSETERRRCFERRFDQDFGVS